MSTLTITRADATSRVEFDEKDDARFAEVAALFDNAAPGSLAYATPSGGTTETVRALPRSEAHTVIQSQYVGG